MADVRALTKSGNRSACGQSGFHSLAGWSRLPPMHTDLIPPMAYCADPPHSAFDIGWSYGPVTIWQDRAARRYANAIKANVRDVPGYWLNPPPPAAENV